MPAESLALPTSAVKRAESASQVLEPASAHLFYDETKRVIDCLIAVCVLSFLAPLWIGISAAIRLTSPGPALFSRTVIGKRGVPFTYYKFRTMRHRNDDGEHRAFLESYVKDGRPFAVERDRVTGEERHVYKVVRDSRVTPLGAILRRLSLDEIPQLFNVLRGEMSIVGPRPPIEFEYALYDDATKARLLVLPGITGLAQIKGRGTLSFADMVRADMEYIRTRSLLTDLKIMLATVRVMVRGA